MPRTKKQSEELRKSRIDLIKETALELFANFGFHSTSIAEIAKAASISKGLLYNYFESKEVLLQSIIAEGLNETYASFDRDGDGVLTPEEFEYFVRKSFEIIKVKKRFFRLFYTLIMHTEVQSFVAEHTKDKGERMLKITQQYFSDRFSDPETEILLFVSLIKGLNMQYVFSEDPFFTDAAIGKAIDRIIEQYKK